MLTHWPSPDPIQHDDPVARQPLDVLLDDWAASSDAAAPVNLTLVAVPAIKCFQLLHILDHRQVDTGRLFPSYEGAAKTVLDELRRRVVAGFVSSIDPDRVSG